MSETDRKLSNGFNGEQLTEFLDRIDSADDEILSLKSDYMIACKAPRSRIRAVMGQAKEQGLNMEALRAIIAKHRAERKVEQKLAEMEADDLADYQHMLHALGEFGDTPLGQAALAKAKQNEESLNNLAAG